MDTGLQIAIISAGSALLGTLGGSIATFLGTKRISREQWRLSQIDKEITAREKLYGEFIGQVSLLAISAIDKKITKVSDFAPLHTLLAQIGVVATAPVVAAARQAARYAVDSHTAEGVKDKEPLGHTFSQAARKELDALRVKGLRKVD